LSAAYELKRIGLDPLVLEKTASVGDVWRNHYDGLRLNSGRVFSQLPGSPFRRSAGGWPSRDELVHILETFPERGGFKVRTRVNIEKVEYDRQRDTWTISSQDGETFESRAVVVATGGARVPIIPKWEGIETFPGEIIHSSKFENARAYAGKDVLIVGSGNSAAEIASRLAEHARTVTISVRTPPHILPKSVFGIPLIGIGVATRSLPLAWVDSLLCVTTALHRRPDIPRPSFSCIPRIAAVCQDPGSADSLLSLCGGYSRRTHPRRWSGQENQRAEHTCFSFH
jgi:putative flavoprotein involved in K+ transport